MGLVEGDRQGHAKKIGDRRRYFFLVVSQERGEGLGFSEISQYSEKRYFRSLMVSQWDS